MGLLEPVFTAHVCEHAEVMQLHVRTPNNITQAPFGLHPDGRILDAGMEERG